MITFISCSIDPDKAEALRLNLSEMTGDDCEYLTFNNSASQWGLARVYNQMAATAKNDFLCFLHDDVRFATPGFDRIIEAQLARPHTGAIGFMGGIYKTAAPSGWNIDRHLNRMHFVQHNKGRMEVCQVNIAPTADFVPCLTLDGACLFVRREVWRQCPFDEKLLTGFHGYDIDFTLQLAASHYCNYVCNCVSFEHFSKGSFNLSWVRETLKLHNIKWNRRLPMSIDGFKPDASQSDLYEAKAYYGFMKTVIKTSLPLRETWLLLMRFPNKRTQIGRFFKLCYKLPFYRLLHRSR